MATHLTDNYINSIIGEGSLFRGDLTVKGLLRVDGDLIGTLTTDHRILVGTQGRLRGTLHAREIIVGGAIKGDLYATDKVVIYASGLVLGNVYAPKIVVEDGAVLEGYCWITPRIMEEGVRPTQAQSVYTLKIDRSKLPASTTDGSVRADL